MHTRHRQACIQSAANAAAIAAIAADADENTNGTITITAITNTTTRGRTRARSPTGSQSVMASAAMDKHSSPSREGARRSRQEFMVAMRPPRSGS